MPNPSPRSRAPVAARGQRLWGSSRAGSKAGLVGLSTAAILSVYAVGYLHTSATGSTAPAGADAAAAVTASLSPTAPAPSRTSTATGNTVPRTQATPAPTSTPKTSSAAYRDGTYAGTGTSRHGNISVAVVVTNGRITSAEITSCQTRYPCSKVAALPGQVVSRQSATVSYVSGATDSSKAYAGAVAQALAKAAV